jgi:hypothetical protein
VLQGGEQGAAVQEAARAALLAHGYTDPDNDLLSYYPELLKR